MLLKGYTTIKELADEFGVTTARIRQLCGEHGIEGVKVGTVRLLSKDEVKRLKNVKRRKYEKAETVG